MNYCDGYRRMRFSRFHVPGTFFKIPLLSALKGNRSGWPTRETFRSGSIHALRIIDRIIATPFTATIATSLVRRHAINFAVSLRSAACAVIDVTRS